MHNSRRIADYSRIRDPELLYRFQDGKQMVEVDLLEEKIDGITIQKILDEFRKTKADLIALENKMGYFIRNAGVKVLEEVAVINPKKVYTVAQTDEMGRITSVGSISVSGTVMEGEPIPDGVEVGYHRIVENKIVEDTKLKYSYYRLM